jgi:hypothetical protein
MNAEIKRIQADESTSFWLLVALKTALDRDPIDAARDARELSKLLTARADEALALKNL